MSRLKRKYDSTLAISGFAKQILSFSKDNLVPGSTNRYRLNFQSTMLFGLESQVALVQGGLYYSWYNISAKKENNQVTIRWIDGNTLVYTFADGLYSIDSISGALEFAMASQGWYLIDNNGNNQYYITVAANAVYGKVQIYFTALPSALPSGWSYPSGATWTTAAKTPQLTIPSGMGGVLGFTPGTYPASTTYTTGQMEQKASTTLTGTGTTFTAAMVGGTVTFADTTTALVTAYTSATALTLNLSQTEAKQNTNITYNNQTTSIDYLSDTTPQISSVFTVVVNCSLVNNSLMGVNQSQLYCLNGVGNVSPFGAVQFPVNEYLWLPVVTPQASFVEIWLTDQSGNPLEQTDTNASFTIYLQTPQTGAL